MLLAVLILHVTVLTLANPFHKYPYVFLLDVGNEELEKVNTEQIRISKQGGSLALRFPAIGYGEDIAHVRVSGIDFGTDLRANIVDGGPGYKYVVLVLIGKPGLAFDAVVTVQTLPKENSDDNGLQTINNDSSDSDYQVSQENDSNDSAEDLSDSAESEESSQVIVSKDNAELKQESSNVYSYAVNEALSGYGNDVHTNVNDENENSNYDYKDDGEDINEEKDQIQVDEINEQLDDYTNDDDSPNLIENQSQETQNNDDYSSVIEDQNYAHDFRNQEQVAADVYGQYEDSKQKYSEEQIYPQRFIPDDSGTIHIEELGDNPDFVNLRETFNDEYDDEGSRKYIDNNNNVVDRNDGSAISY